VGDTEQAILVEGSGRNSGYDPECFDELALVEDRHYWFRARSKAISAIAAQITAAVRPSYRILEVGCGTGNVLRALRQSCPGAQVIGMDFLAEGLRHAQRRSNCPLVQGDLRRPPFSPVFNLVGAFDVIEHVQDDVMVLGLLHNLLRPDGLLLLTVPAHPNLWSYFDEYSCHCRRYAKQDLRKKLVQTGFKVEYLTPYMSATLPLLWLARRAFARGRIAAGAELDPSRVRQLAARELRVIPVFNQILAFVLSQEANFLSRRWQLPFGSSFLVVASKTL